METICAVATPPGQGGVAVVRVSGCQAISVAESVAGPVGPARKACLRGFYSPDGEKIDEGLMLAFPGPGSYTGEDVVELHAHGSTAVARALVRALCAQGARQAGPGEFSERAFLNGRLDLTQAEGVAALIEAESEGARRAGLRALEGEFGRRVRGLAERFRVIRAEAEAVLDFPDSEEVGLEEGSWREGLRTVKEELEDIRCRARAGARIRNGLRVALVGPPNAGKSSLLNAVSGRDAAIVTGVPGTTRDVLKETTWLGGQSVEVRDTAGLRQEGAGDEVEEEGIRRAREVAGESDVLVIVVEAGVGVSAEERALLERHKPRPAVVALNKVDEVEGRWPGEGRREGESEWWVTVSAARREGLDCLERVVAEAVQEGVGEDIWAAQERHLEVLDRVRHALEEADRVSDGEVELVADALRRGHEALGEITGEVSDEAVLEEIFSRFCIGK